MKQILIIDESPLFREYLKLKLEDNEGVEAAIAINSLDGTAKMRNLLPDLIVMDYHLKKGGCMEVLKAKKENPNTVMVPVIILAQQIDQRKIIELVQYNVKKVFTKPIKIDAFFATLKGLLGLEFTVDETPGIVEVHVNEDIIFVEIAQGLNRDKLDLLRFKIIELIELYEIAIPKIIVMLSDLKLNFADAPNLKKLLETIMGASKTRARYIRVLTRDPFARKYIEEQKDYQNIEVVSNLQYAMDGLLSDVDGASPLGDMKAEIIGDRILSGTGVADGESMQLRFDGESRKAAEEDLKEGLNGLRIAVVDDDFIIQELIKNTFAKTGAVIDIFGDGADFVASPDASNFDLIFLDQIMPRMDGFAVLKALKMKDITTPVIMLSSITQREKVIVAFQLGIKSYLTKPLKPDAIFRKTMEILKPNF